MTLQSNIKHKMCGERLEQLLQHSQYWFLRLQPQNRKNALKVCSKVCKSVSTLKTNNLKNDKTIYRILQDFFVMSLAETFPAAYVSLLSFPLEVEVNILHFLFAL